MSASTSTSTVSLVMSAVDKKAHNLVDKYDIKRDLDDIQDGMMDYLIKLKDEDLIEVLSKRKTIYKYRYVFPMMAYLFRKCQSVIVCNWLTENTIIEDDAILREFLEEEEPEEWKVKLTNIWLAGFDNQVESDDETEYDE